MNAEPDNYLKIIDGLNEEIRRLREREAQLERDASAYATDAELEARRAEAAEDVLGMTQARVRELEGQLLRAREAPGGPQDQRVRELEEERDSANRSSFAANEILHERTNQLEAAEARVRELEKA